MSSSKLIVLTNHIFLFGLFSFMEYISECDPLTISQVAGNTLHFYLQLAELSMVLWLQFMTFIVL